MRTGRIVERNREMEKGSSVWRGARPGEGGPTATRYRNSLVAPFTDYSWRSVSRERRRASERLWTTAAEGIGLGKGASHGAPRRRRGCSRSTRLGSTLLYSPERRSETRLSSGTQAHRWLVGWLAGLAWRTESPPGHPPRPFTGTEPHPIPVTLIHLCTDSRPRLGPWEGRGRGEGDGRGAGRKRKTGLSAIRDVVFYETRYYEKIDGGCLNSVRVAFRTYVLHLVYTNICFPNVNLNLLGI